jgi:Gas vesicle protein G
MFLLDDILLSPVNGFVWLCRQIQTAALKEFEVTPEQISEDLSLLYMMLETEQITIEEFEARETELLDLLDELQAEAEADNDEDEDDEELDEELDDDDDEEDEEDDELDEDDEDDDDE